MQTKPNEVMPPSDAPITTELQTYTAPACTDSGAGSEGKFVRVVKKILRVLAIIASVLLSVVLLLLLTAGILLGTMSIQLSPEPVASVVYETDFYAVLSAMGVEEELSLLYSRAVNAISSESTEYYTTLEELLSSREFKNFVASSINRLLGAFSENGFSVYLRSDDVMMLAGFLTGPVEQYLGFTLTDEHMELIESALDILGIGGKLLTVPLGEFVGVIYAVRFLLADSLRYAIFFACAVTVLLIFLLNRKHLLMGAVTCAVPLVLNCITWTSFSFTTTLVLILLRIKISALATPAIIYTASARDYMANLSLVFLVFAIAIMLIPWGIKYLKAILSKKS